VVPQNGFLAFFYEAFHADAFEEFAFVLDAEDFLHFKLHR
jgi:hypothetical protein